MGRLIDFSGRRLYLDANIFIYVIEGFAAFEPKLHMLLDAIQRKSIFVVTSQMTLAEVLVKPLQKNAGQAVDRYEALLGAVETVAVDSATWRLSAELRAHKKLTLPDAVHVATAMRAGCEFFLTEDRDIRLPETLSIIRLADLQKL